MPFNVARSSAVWIPLIRSLGFAAHLRTTSEAVGRPLKNVRFPAGVIVGVLFRDGEAIIPNGDDVIHPGDEVFIFGTKSAIPKLEKLMSVRLEFF